MPPARTSSAVPAKRRPPPFKPPRPVASSETLGSAEPTSSAREQGTFFRPYKKVDGKPATRKPSVLISDDEEESEEHESLSDTDRQNDTEAARDILRTRKPTPVQTKRPAAASESSPPTIPQKLLARLLYDSFADKNTKIGKEALVVFGKYIEIFAREALARAALEQEEASMGTSNAGDGFLQVEDLERLAPQLMLDF